MPGKVDELLEGLNEEQREAVSFTEGPLLILAGAGSGKTRVLTQRFAYLVEKNKCFPEEILAITFTNKAANEMKNRVQEFLEVDNRLWISTFHAAAARILRGSIHHLGYERNFVILDSQDQSNLIKECLKELNYDFQSYTPRKIIAIISKAKNELMDENLYEETARDFYSCRVSDLYRLYQKKLRVNNCLDFDDLLFLTVRLLKEYPEILNYYQDKFKYIMVDEYQDTNMAQYILVNLLAQKHRNLCVVGDDDQSIYQFRGADLRNILEFEGDYPEARVIKLEENYRSQGNILEAAFHVVKNNMQRKEKRLWTRKPAGEKIFYFCGENEQEEAAYVIDEIKKNRDKYEDIAILYRTNAQSRVIEEALVKENMAYSIYGGLKFYERREIKDVLAYLRVVDNPGDAISLKRIINVPKRGIGKKTVEKLEEWAGSRGITLFEALTEAREAGVYPGISKKIGGFYNIINNFRNMREFLTVQELTEEIIDKTGYMEFLEAEGTPDSLSRIENVRELVSVTREFDFRGEEKDLTSFLTGISLVASSDEVFEEEDRKRLVCMTLHSAKGLEFSVVFLIGMEEGIFPHYFALEEAEGLEEERRLCYVGCTRAKEKLYLTHARQRTSYGRVAINAPSRFLEEIPSELFDAPAAREEKEVKNSNWSRGDLVYHEKWGQGRIKEVGDSGGDTVLTVLFPQVGTKIVLAAYAPLKKLQAD
ncbi:MAG: DNA helicase PcrA [Candidatus Syntrophonatronum acetioxidans]|uniref:ATP-dependent DNA helicase n=1 Tax=Candidatus Syntrophonatronum acetioxidans TaxID=1795816 RepID=A0A424YDN4_9FIRM|nr:MAG: DNA helicase PcrA [Candidatus Syntrophonatronum acetioxidans]